jgi:PIN domain nuclease of toxin-antitoxin system
LLLDTHIALWAVILDPRLSAMARDLIGDTNNDVFVSVATIWEIAIKTGLTRGAKTDMPINSTRAIELFQASGYRLLDIAPAHAAAVEALPKFHADPFDRMLIAQAITEPLRLLTHDIQVMRYSDVFIYV